LLNRQHPITLSLSDRPLSARSGRSDFLQQDQYEETDEVFRKFLQLLASRNRQCRNECALNTSASIEFCVAENHKKADQELNVVYRQTIDRVAISYKAAPELRTELLSKLRSAQTAWIKFRDANCAIYAFEIEESKPAYMMALNECKTRMTKDRSKELLNGFPNV
jgi:uncharacterized protein YecT (DUF1311 family)